MSPDILSRPQDVFTDSKRHMAAFSEVLTILSERYHLNPADVAVIATCLGHLAWHGIESEFKLDITIDAIEREVKERGWTLFTRADRLARRNRQ